ncbi:MAG TPA: metallopeptidase TldD-related protein [Gemmatimonadaceae bacterium]|jgi:predicted Zn-dependent protease|nr:metallopeptidase TldD-related protein [Gemmatimonadaceae bacterium]
MPPHPRFLSQEDCQALAKRVADFALGGGETGIMLVSNWMGTLRWAQNQVSNSSEVRTNLAFVNRMIRGATAGAFVNQIDDAALTAAVRRAERELQLKQEQPESARKHEYTVEPYLQPKIWSDATYNLSAADRVKTARALTHSAVAAGVMSAGNIEVAAIGQAAIDSTGRSLYYPYTQAQCTITVRDEQAGGSGWAGVDHNDWRRIDGHKLAEIALDKCLRSRHPVPMEPGRYITILEPQAVCDFIAPMLDRVMDRGMAEGVPGMGPFSRHSGTSRIGERVMDERITISADPMDPDLGFPPFAPFSFTEVYHPVTWVEQGVLKQLAYSREYAIRNLGLNTGLPNSGAFRMSGGDTSLEEMIATTRRGVLVTRFSNVELLDIQSLMQTGYTRDGVWLIENGKISKPLKNFRFRESPLFAFNNLEQLGPAQRVFRPQAPAITPYAKVRDFSFTALVNVV